MATKMTKGTFKSRTVKGMGFEVRDGYLFDLLLTDNTIKQMGVYKSDEDGVWYVVDLATGLSLCDSTSRKDAVARATSEPVVKRFTGFINGKRYHKSVELFNKICGLGENPVKAPQKPAESTKPTRKAPEPPKPEPKPTAEAERPVDKTAQPIVVSLETMREWCKERENVCATMAAGAGATVKIHGDTKPYKDELKTIGFRWSKKGFWWAYPTA